MVVAAEEVLLLQILAPPLVGFHKPRGREDQCHERERKLRISFLSFNFGKPHVLFSSSFAASHPSFDTPPIYLFTRYSFSIL